jgi:hypothetical protein
MIEVHTSAANTKSAPMTTRSGEGPPVAVEKAIADVTLEPLDTRVAHIKPAVTHPTEMTCKTRKEKTTCYQTMEISSSNEMTTYLLRRVASANNNQSHEHCGHKASAFHEKEKGKR